MPLFPPRNSAEWKHQSLKDADHLIWADHLRANNQIAQRNMTRLGLGQISRNRETVTSCKANSILRGRGGDRWYQEAGVSDQGGRSGVLEYSFQLFFPFSKIDGTQVQGSPVEPHKRTNFFPGDKTLWEEDLFNIQRLENRFCYFYQFSFLVFGGMVKYWFVAGQYSNQKMG